MKSLVGCAQLCVEKLHSNDHEVKALKVNLVESIGSRSIDEDECHLEYRSVHIVALKSMKIQIDKPIWSFP